MLDEFVAANRETTIDRGGAISVLDLTGKGCIFTLGLPRKPPPPLAVSDGGKNTVVGTAGTLRGAR